MEFDVLDESLADSPVSVGACQAYIPMLKDYLAVHKAEMPLSGALALESGIRGYEAQAEWARNAVRAYKKRGRS
jgi:hypothetical protein